MIKQTILTGILLFLSTNISTFAQTVPAETVNHGKLFIDAINSGSEKQYLETVSVIFSNSALENPGLQKLSGMMQSLHSSFAPLEYHHSEIIEFVMGDNSVSRVMHIYAKKKDAAMWSDFQMRLEPAAPFKFTKLAFVAEVTEPIALPNGSIEQKQTLDWLENYLENLKSGYDLSGSILIAKGDRILFEKYFGFADAEKNRSITSGTLFNMASGGKMFTALAIARLVEDRILDYNDPVTKYLDGFNDKATASKITIHQLLSHTSGINEYWTDKTDKAVYTAKNISDHLKIVYQAGFAFEPGTDYAYCNSNFIVLGAIIERISGRSFYEYIQDSVLKPAEMASTGYFDYGSKNMANSLARNEKQDGWIMAKHGIRGSSAGGAYSNCRDILKFSNALKNNQIVKNSTFQNLITPKNGVFNAASESYGYGFILRKYDINDTYGHGGTADGVNFTFRYFPADDITLIIFSNQNNGAYDDLKKNSTKLISGQR